jgi:hypothetical protein
MASAGGVVSLHIASGAGAEMRALTEVLAVAGRGIEGDRYFTHTGTYSKHPGSGRSVTLIEIEAIEALARDYDVHLVAGLARRHLARHALVRTLHALGNARGQRRSSRADSPRRATCRNPGRRFDLRRRRHRYR